MEGGRRRDGEGGHILPVASRSPSSGLVWSQGARHASFSRSFHEVNGEERSAKSRGRFLVHSQVCRGRVG